MYPDAVDSFPFPITEEIVKRGEDRYNIFCGLCHGPTGYGDGMIIRRGFRRVRLLIIRMSCGSSRRTLL